MKNLIYILLIAIAFACETTINPKLDDAEEIIVIDAWVNQKMERQEIKISRSQPYFENDIPENLSGASVSIEDLNSGQIYDFEEGSDVYYWDPIDSPFGEIGHEYRLSVVLDGESYEARSKMGRVPGIDTIKYTHFKDNLFIDEEYYMGEFIARDPLGEGDAYWVKAWKNGVYLGKPGELNMVYDGGFSPSQAVDGEVFLIPIRRDFVSPFDENPDNEGDFLPPYLPGDSLYVEIHSLDPLAFDFLFGVYFHINRPGGFAELFSTPLGNAISNIENKTSDANVAGFFNVSAVSSKGQRLTQEIADEAKTNGG